MQHRPPSSPAPWWRVGIVWLVIGATVAVVAACFWMIRVSQAGADVALKHTPATGSAMPAMQGRNHVASPRPAAP